MIVRCNNCVSAFAVDDEKIANKKFAFTCPKCNSENIIDNRIISKKLEEKNVSLDEAFFNDDFSVDTDFPAKEKEHSASPEPQEDDLFFNETPAEKEDKFDSIEDEFATEFPADDIPAEPAKKNRNINLEIEESADFPEFDDDIFAEKASPAKKEKSGVTPGETAAFDSPEFDDDIFAEKPSPAKKEKINENTDEFVSFDTEDEFISFDEKVKDKPSRDEFEIELKEESVKPEDDELFFDDFDELPEKPVKKEETIKDESGDEVTGFEFDDIKNVKSEDANNEREKKLTSQDDIDALFAEEGIVFDEKPISKQSEKEFEDEITVDLDLLDIDLEESGDENNGIETQKIISGKAEASASDEIITDMDDFDFDFEETPSGPELSVKSAVSSAAKEKSLTPEDDITLDIDNLDIDLEETPLDSDLFEEPANPAKTKAQTPPPEEDITLDIDNLDIDLEETPLDTELFEEPAAPKKAKAQTPSPEDDITLDIDNLDIDFEETPLSHDLSVKSTGSSPARAKALPPEDDITLDIDNLDIELDETPLDSDLFEEPKKPAKARSLPQDEDITLDIDNLDIDLDEPLLDSDIFDEPAVQKSAKNAKAQALSDENEFNEEDIKLNLDDLDIDLDEIEDRELIFEDDVIESPSPAPGKKAKPVIAEEDEDESITIDLDTLELEIAEENSVMKGELSEEDEKLTLDDAGLTFDELTSKTVKSEFDETADEDIKLTLDEIDPDLTLEKIARSGKVETKLVSDTLEELPEIDLDEYDAIVRQEESGIAKKSFHDSKNLHESNKLYESHELHEPDRLSESHESHDDFIVFPEFESEKTESASRDYDMLDYEETELEKSTSQKGSTFFSIDYSLKYSRIGALLRLLGLYMISMIPHFVVMLVYTILSSILGFINQIVILSTGQCVEDFASIIEKTMRYFFYIKTNIIGIVEDRPVYTGKEYLDHPLQLNITLPLKYSKNLAILRLSIIGVLLITLPHLLILTFITVTIPVVYLVGIISVIITRRWPNILFIYLTKYFRYQARVSSFMTGLTDEYPSFNFD